MPAVAQAPDDPKAEAERIAVFKDWKKKADSGDTDANFVVALMYTRGLGVKKNFTEAANHFRVAAQHGHIGAQLHLASLYVIGLGVEQSKFEALMWYEVAKTSGQEDLPGNHLARYRKLTMLVPEYQQKKAKALAQQWISERSSKPINQEITVAPLPAPGQ